MQPLDQARFLAERFYDWELRGRGWQAWNYAVDIEPPFRPVSFEPPARTNGSSALARALAALEEREARRFEGWEEPFANPAAPTDVLVHIPLEISPGQSVRGLSNPLVLAPLENHRECLAFEIAAEGSRMRAQLSTAYAPGCDSNEDIVPRVLQAPPKSVTFVELGLAQEFLVPLPADDSAYARVLRTFSQLGEDEAGLLQILFQPTCEPWADEMLRAALGPEGVGLFGGQDDLVNPCRRKISKSLYAVVVRIMGAAPDAWRARSIADGVTKAFRRSAAGSANTLIALPDRDDTFADEIVARISRRSGMILNRDELATLVPFRPPAEFADTAQQAHGANEAQIVGCRVPSHARDAPAIRRRIISPQEGLLRPAMLARFARLQSG